MIVSDGAACERLGGSERVDLPGADALLPNLRLRLVAVTLEIRIPAAEGVGIVLARRPNGADLQPGAGSVVLFGELGDVAAGVRHPAKQTDEEDHHAGD